MGPRPDLEVSNQPCQPVPEDVVAGNEPGCLVPAGNEVDPQPAAKGQVKDADCYPLQVQAVSPESRLCKFPLPKSRQFFPDTASWDPLLLYSPKCLALSLLWFIFLAIYQVSWATAMKHKLQGSTDLLPWFLSGLALAASRVMQKGVTSWLLFQLFLNNPNVNTAYYILAMMVVVLLTECVLINLNALSLFFWGILSACVMSKVDAPSGPRRSFMIKFFGMIIGIQLPTYILVLFMPALLAAVNSDTVGAMAFPFLSWASVASQQWILLWFWNQHEDKPKVEPPGLAIFTILSMCRSLAELFNYCGMMFLVNKHKGTDKLTRAAIQLFVTRFITQLLSRLGFWDSLRSKLHLGSGEMHAGRDIIGRATHAAAWLGLPVILYYAVLALAISISGEDLDGGLREPVLWIGCVMLWQMSMSVEIIAAIVVKLHRARAQPDLTLTQAFKNLSRPGNQPTLCPASTDGGPDVVCRNLPDGDVATISGLTKHGSALLASLWICMGISVVGAYEQMLLAEVQ